MGLRSSAEREKGRYGFLSDSITASQYLYIHIFLLVSSGDIHIIPNNAQGGIVAPTLKDSTAHFLRLFLHSILPECL